MSYMWLRISRALAGIGMGSDCNDLAIFADVDFLIRRQTSDFIIAANCKPAPGRPLSAGVPGRPVGWGVLYITPVISLKSYKSVHFKEFRQDFSDFF